jgi:Kelch motif
MPMTSPRIGHTATRLADGRVLVVGGIAQRNVPLPITPKLPIVGVYTRGPSAEIYSPVPGSWLATGTTTADRVVHAATLLGDGRVLVTGGYDIDTGRPLATTEIYDPLTDLWEGGPEMGSAHAVHTATLLGDGSVLVTGGGDLDGYGTSSSAERYRPGAGAWTAAGSMGWARALHTATLLLDGRVLVAGGRSAASGTLAVAELFTG